MQKPYLTCDAWPHIFEGGGERYVRFVYSKEDRKILAMNVLVASRWVPSSKAQLEDVQDSLLNANEEALEDPEEYGLEEVSALPDWAN